MGKIQTLVHFVAVFLDGHKATVHRRRPRETNRSRLVRRECRCAARSAITEDISRFAGPRSRKGPRQSPAIALAPPPDHKQVEVWRIFVGRNHPDSTPRRFGRSSAHAASHLDPAASQPHQGSLASSSYPLEASGEARLLGDRLSQRGPAWRNQPSALTMPPA